MGHSLLSLPVELQRAIFLHLDGGSLACVSDTCQCLRAVANDKGLWMKLVCARYRVSQRVMQSRRLQANGGTSWKTLYFQWDSCQRMPMSRISGPSFPAIVKARSGNALMWCTVYSSDDCRLIANNNNGNRIIRIRLIVQNIDASGQLHLRPSKCEITTHDNGRRNFETVQIFVERNSGKKELIKNDIDTNMDLGKAEVRLNKDEFAIIRLHVNIRGGEDVNFELDALEQLREIQLPVTYSGSRKNNITNTMVRGPEIMDFHSSNRTKLLKAEFRQKTILDMYTFVNGFWLRQ